MKYNRIVIGIDQSYKYTGVTISGDGKILKVAGLDMSLYKTKTQKRLELHKYIEKVALKTLERASAIDCIIERIRLYSDGFLNINYIKSIGALNSVIIDTMAQYDVEVYSVDTRAWKSQVVGTSKPKSNAYGVDPKKYPTIEWLINKGFEKDILEEVTGRKTKGTFIQDGKKYRYNDDKADSAAISLFGFVGKKEQLQKEE